MQDDAAGPCRLYLVTPATVDATFADTLARALDAGDVAAVQLRLKDVDDQHWRQTIEALRPVAQSRNVAFLLNDRADLVADLGCDGVHVGQADMNAKQARSRIGKHLTLGVTCHDSRDLAMQAGEDTADYVAFGAFYPTTTKTPEFHAEPDILAWWSEIMELPCVAIGGINPTNCKPLIHAGATFLAVVNTVWAHPKGPAAGVAEMNAAIAEALKDMPEPTFDRPNP